MTIPYSLLLLLPKGRASGFATSYSTCVGHAIRIAQAATHGWRCVSSWCGCRRVQGFAPSHLLFVTRTRYLTICAHGTCIPAPRITCPPARPASTAGCWASRPRRSTSTSVGRQALRYGSGSMSILGLQAEAEELYSCPLHVVRAGSAEPVVNVGVEGQTFPCL